MEECDLIAHRHPHQSNRQHEPAISIHYYPDGFPQFEAEIPNLYESYASSYYGEQGSPVTVITERSEHTPDEEGDVCDYGGGSNNGVVAQWGKRYLCLEDFDDDGVANFFDDCPLNSNNSYCSDLPDCDGVASAAYEFALASVGGTAYWLTAKGVMLYFTVPIAGGVVVSGTAVIGGIAAGVAVIGGGGYCLVSELEN